MKSSSRCGTRYASRRFSLPAVSRARAGIAYLWVERLGHPGRSLAPLLGIHPAVVYQAARRGAAHAQEWEHLLGHVIKAT